MGALVLIDIGIFGECDRVYALRWCRCRARTATSSTALHGPRLRAAVRRPVRWGNGGQRTAQPGQDRHQDEGDESRGEGRWPG